jgi:hypothetical protein
MMNIPQPPIYNMTIGSAVADVNVTSMMQAAREAVAETEEDDFDSTWTKSGHNRLNDIISTTSVDRGKVLGVEIMNKICFVCHTNPTSQHECKKNHEGISGGMEGAAVLNIFNHSLYTQGIGTCYTKYLGDVDRKAYQ